MFLIACSPEKNWNLTPIILERLYPGEARVSVTGKTSKAMADQIMTADKVRLKSRIDVLSKADLNAVDLALRVQLALPI